MEIVNSGPIIDADEAIRICSMEPVLSFENFVRVKNNFQLHFTGNFVGGIYRSQVFYCRCVVACPAFCRLVKRLMAYPDLGNHLSELYEAYKMMRPYASSNWEMFQ